ncbi:hypothetical protein [Micromonospora coxensis]
MSPDRAGPVGIGAGRLAHLPVERLCDEVLADLVDAPRDDIALLALRVTG